MIIFNRGAAISTIDELVKSLKTPFFVIPAKAGIQFFQLVTESLDSGFHRSDDFLRDRQSLFVRFLFDTRAALPGVGQIAEKEGLRLTIG